MSDVTDNFRPPARDSSSGRPLQTRERPEGRLTRSGSRAVCQEWTRCLANSLLFLCSSYSHRERSVFNKRRVECAHDRATSIHCGEGSPRGSSEVKKHVHHRHRPQLALLSDRRKSSLAASLGIRSSQAFGGDEGACLRLGFVGDASSLSLAALHATATFDSRAP